MAESRNRAVTWGAATCAAVAAYAVAESRRYRVVERTIPVPAGGPSMTILHVSDPHLMRRRLALRRFLMALPDRLPGVPDLVLATGDLIEDDTGIDPLVEAFGRLEARHGRFYVLGSHDYYRSSLAGFAGALKMFAGKERTPYTAVKNSVHLLEEGLQSKGWVALTNRTEFVEVAGIATRLAGVDDPYLRRHRTEHAARSRNDDLAVALMHSPDAVSEWVLAGYDLVLAGHTHAGQVRLPLLGAIVTNSSLPTGLAGGLHRIGGTWVHVSPGLGHGRYLPFRVLAPPEATLLRLNPG
jgi:uncharacterized protein